MVEIPDKLMLTLVFDLFVGYCARGERLVDTNSPIVLFIFQDVHDRLEAPFFLPGGRRDSGLFELLLYGDLAVPGQITLVYPSNNSGFRLIDGHFAVLIIGISIAFSFEEERGTIVDAFLNAPLNVSPPTFVVRLGISGHYGQKELAVGVHGGDVVVNKDDLGIILSQFSGNGQGIKRIPPQAADGANEYDVDHAESALREETLKLRPVVGGGTGTNIDIDALKAPASMIERLVDEIAGLRTDAAKLFVTSAADAAVHGDALNGIDSSRGGNPGDNLLHGDILSARTCVSGQDCNWHQSVVY